MLFEYDLSTRLLGLDPTGAARHGFSLVERYVPVVTRQHGLISQAWMAKDHTRALVELHFFLIAVDRVCDGLQLAADVLGGDLAAHVSSHDYKEYKDARNHFEHLEDRLFGSGKNAPRPIEEGGNSRTVHFGLKASTKSFRWGNRSISISEAFLSGFLDYVDKARAITLGAA